MTTPAAAKRRTPQEVLLQILDNLRNEEFERFKWLVCLKGTFEDFPSIPPSRLENADRMNTVDQMFRTYCINTVKVTKRLLVKIRKNDLLEEFPTNMSEPSGKSGKDSVGCFNTCSPRANLTECMTVVNWT